MSKLVERLDAIFEGSCPMPPHPTSVLYPSRESFTALYSLAQAWPLLRTALLQSEAHNAALARENRELASERDELRDRFTAEYDAADRNAHYAGKLVEDLRAQLDACRGQLATATRELALIPERSRAAEAVCASLDPHRAGIGTTWAYFDGIALDRWKRAVEP